MGKEKLKEKRKWEAVPAGCVMQEAPSRSNVYTSRRPIDVDCRPSPISTASMLGACIPQYGDTRSAAHVCSRLAVGAAALAMGPSRSATCVMQWCSSRSQPMLRLRDEIRCARP